MQLHHYLERQLLFGYSSEKEKYIFNLSRINKHIILKTNDLEIGYKSKKSINSISKNINISLEKGKFVCLLGQNGIGKSTLLRTLTKVQPKLNGTIFFNNKSIEKVNQLDFSKQVSVVLTERLPESNLSVYELIALGRQPYTNWLGKLNEQDIKKINEAIELVKIGHIKHSKYYELSDGQLQKVLIARAIAQDTEIIILDEPTAHLDVLHKMETFKLLKSLTKKLQKTIIISSHEIHLALETSDDLWLMTNDNFKTGNKDILIENGELEQLFNSDLIAFNKDTKRFKLKS